MGGGWKIILGTALEPFIYRLLGRREARTWQQSLYQKIFFVTAATTALQTSKETLQVIIVKNMILKKEVLIKKRKCFIDKFWLLNFSFQFSKTTLTKSSAKLMTWNTWKNMWFKENIFYGLTTITSGLGLVLSSTSTGVSDKLVLRCDRHGRKHYYGKLFIFLFLPRFRIFKLFPGNIFHRTEFNKFRKSSTITFRSSKF